MQSGASRPKQLFRKHDGPDVRLRLLEIGGAVDVYE
jgi:hypothetical protein